MKAFSFSVLLAIVAVPITAVGCASDPAEEIGDSTEAYSHERLYISDHGCGSQELSSFGFQNVGNEDFNEGAPNFVTLHLCQSGGYPLRYRLVSPESCYGRSSGTVSFQNVGHNDTGEGAPSRISVSLCSDDDWGSRYYLTDDGSCNGSSVTFRNVGSEDDGEGAPTFVTVALCRY